jgi:selenocysteine-specific elongation factor
MSTRQANITLGTAGHIDHGKTALVKLFTGCDTDHLKEEKERGMSIDLGHAPCVVAELEVGIVDVPGHERFVKTMVAGATGIDGVILVVAADDGVMPQTREHLDILTLLGIEHGIVALTKIDRVDADHAAIVKDDLAQFLKGTFLDGAPIVPMSSITAEGYDAFYTALADLVRSITPKQPTGVFRMPVERTFSAKGYGTVVTGIPVAGSAAVGDELQLLPGGATGRVSTIEVYGRPAETAMAGQCAAINVRQWEKDTIRRGDTIARPGYFEPNLWWACKLRLLPHEKLFVKNGTKVKLHTGTAETPASIYLTSGDTLRAADEQIIQVRADDAIVAGPGDHFIIRSLSPVLTIGGGTIVEALPHKLKRSKPGVVEDIEERAAATGAAETFIEYAVKRPADGPAGAPDVAQRTKLPVERVQAVLDELVAAGRILPIPPRHFLHADTLAALGNDVADALARFHEEAPQSPGLSSDQLQERSGLAKNVLSAVVEHLVAGGTVTRREGRLALARHTVSLSSDEQRRLDRVEVVFRSDLFHPPTIHDVTDATGVPAQRVEQAVALLIEHGRLVRVAPDLVFHRDAIEEAKRRLLDHFAHDERFESVKFKYLLDTTRKYALPLLDYFDRIGLTRRVHNTRYLKSKGS